MLHIIIRIALKLAKRIAYEKNNKVSFTIIVRHFASLLCVEQQRYQLKIKIIFITEFVFEGYK